MIRSIECRQQHFIRFNAISTPKSQIKTCARVNVFFFCHVLLCVKTKTRKRIFRVELVPMSIDNTRYKFVKCMYQSNIPLKILCHTEMNDVMKEYKRRHRRRQETKRKNKQNKRKRATHIRMERHQYAPNE